MFEFLQSISDFFQTGIYTFFEETAVYFTSTLMIWWLKAKLAGLEFAWAVAQQILQGFNVSSKLAQGFAMLSPDVMQIVTFFRFPEAVNILISGGATRFILRMLPGF